MHYSLKREIQNQKNHQQSTKINKINRNQKIKRNQKNQNDIKGKSKSFHPWIYSIQLLPEHHNSETMNDCRNSI